MSARALMVLGNGIPRGQVATYGCALPDSGSRRIQGSSL